MTQTVNLLLSYLQAAQAQKHVTVNAALATIDSLLHAKVKDKDVSAPPISPNDGDSYIVPSGATGDWIGEDENIAVQLNGAWYFHSPNPGWLVYVEDEATYYTYSGTAWDSVLLKTSLLQTTPLDGSAGKILRMEPGGIGGPFGLGESLAETSDWNNLTSPGFYYAGSSVTNGPPAVYNYSCVVLQGFNANNVAQIAVSVTTNPTIYLRTKVAGVWNAWEVISEKKPKTETFTTFGSSVTLNNAPIDADHTSVFFDGAFQANSRFSVSGTTVTFTGGTPTATEVSVRYWHN